MIGPSPWNDERDAQLTADWAAGFSTAEIGQRMGISKNSVIGRAHRLRLPSRGSPINLAASESWTDEDDATLRAIYGGFLTAAQIGARMGRSTHAISYRAKFLGLVARRGAKQTRPRHTIARPLAGRDAFFPAQSRPAPQCRPSAAQPGAAADTAHCPSSLDLPEVAAMPPRVFLGTECCHPMGDRTCDEPVQANARGLKSSYCPEHFAIIHATPGKYPTNPPPATWLKNRGMVWARG
jgi:GcrA cell cycle regulator